MQVVREFWAGVFAGLIAASVTFAVVSLGGRVAPDDFLWYVGVAAVVGFAVGAAVVQVYAWQGFRTWARQYFGIDLRALAALRVGLAILLLVDLALRSRDVVAHYSDDGVLPRGLGAYRPSDLTVHMFSGEAWVQGLLFLVAAVIAVALLFGYQTRIATIASWLMLISVQARNPLTSDGAQDLLRLLLFWGMFLPLGARYSVDRALNVSPRRRKNSYASLATFALLVQICCMYWFAYWFKTAPEWQLHGSAVHYALSIDMLSTPIGEFLVGYPQIGRGITFLVIWLEMLMPVLVFFPWRNAACRMIAVVLFWLMHLGFFLCMHIEIFPFACTVAWLAFVPTPVWNTLRRRISTPARCKLVIYYDGTCAFCRRVALLLRTFLLLPMVRLRRCQVDASIEADMVEHNSWVVVDQSGQRYFCFDGLVTLLRHSPVFFPLGWLLGLSWVRAVGNRIYRWTARHRPLMGRLTCCLRVRKPQRFALGTHIYIATVVSLLVAIWLAYILLYNLQWLYPRLPVAASGRQVDVMTWFKKPHYRTIGGKKTRVDFYELGHQLRLDQKWGMFTRVPLRRDGWLVMPGKMPDGGTIDIWSGGPVRWEKPANVSATFPNYRWYKYLEKFHGNSPNRNSKYYPDLCRYLCQQWNRTHGPEQQIESLEVWFVAEFTRPPNVAMQHERVRVLRCECP